LNPSVGCVPQGAHAVGWGCRENGESISDDPKVGWVVKPNTFR
jgi:hypothetical protein